MKRSRGFTLLELMIVVTIVAILAAVAIGAYNKQVRKGRRADAKVAEGAYALKLEKWRTNNINYGVDGATALTNIGESGTSPGGYYTLAITFPTSGTCPSGVNQGNLNSYIITATAATVDQLKDSGCTSMVFTNTCGVPSKTPVDCW